MEIRIKRIDKDTIKVSWGNEFLEISQTSESWNNKGINTFLINLVTDNPNNSQLTIIYDIQLKEKDEIYSYIVQLFEKFIIEVNKKNEINQQQIITKESEKSLNG